MVGLDGLTGMTGCSGSIGATGLADIKELGTLAAGAETGAATGSGTFSAAPRRTWRKTFVRLDTWIHAFMDGLRRTPCYNSKTLHAVGTPTRFGNGYTQFQQNGAGPRLPRVLNAAFKDS